MRGKHPNMEERTGYQTVGPNHQVGGPSGPGSYPTTPDRTLVRQSDPRIEDPVVPKRLYPGPGSSPGGALLASKEEGTGRS
jgi:hypothetical protein